ncbi:hypothetical protein ATKI12_6977 [Kitasatospora sp. Ki12]
MSVSTNLLSANTSGIETDASGWTAGASTTIAQTGTKWRTGAKSLLLTRTGTAGPASATTATRIAVTAGSTYTAYAYYALVVAAAGRTATVRIDWWAGSTGGTALSSATSPVTTLANSIAWNVNTPPIVIATAPTGAAYASMTVAVDGLGASEQACMDDAAVGPVSLLAGNLLSYAAQGVEQDASAWSAWYGLTVGRSSTAAAEGAWSLLLTSTLAGNAQCGGASSVTTTPGTDYVGYASVQPGTADIPFVIDLRWHDASDTYLGTTTSSTWTGLPAGSWSRVAVTGPAPAGAVKARLVLRPQATASGQTWLCDQMGIHAATPEAGNLLTYGQASMEGGVSPWTAVGGGTIVASTAQAAAGSLSLVLTCTGAADAVVSLATPVPVTAGQAYRVRPTVRPPVDSLPYTVRLDWLNSGGQTIRQTSSGIIAGPATAWTASFTSDLAPVGAVSVRPSIVRSGASAGEVWYVDRVYLAAGGLAAWAEPSTAGYGAVVHVQGLSTDGRNRWGLWRTTPDGAQTPVRGYSGDLTAETTTGDTAVVEDYEAPLGVAVAYYVKAWTAPAGADWTAYSVDWLTLPHPDELAVVLKDPALPARNLKATVTTMPVWKRAARQGVHDIRGRARPVILTDVRASRTGNVAVSTATDVERQALVWLLSSGNTLLAQWPASWGEPDTYIQVGDLDEARPSDYAPQPDREWTLALTEVDRPIGGLVGTAGRTWQTVRDGYGTWADVLAGARTWLDVLTGVGGS